MQSHSKPTIILVHGAWHNAIYWEEYFAPWLREQGYNVVCPDLPGHHTTAGTKRIPWYSINDYTDHVAKVVAQQKGPVVVVGHSMGGHVTQKIMEHRPANLVGAGLIASVPPKGVLGVVFTLLTKHPLKLLQATLTMNMYRLLDSTQLAKELLYTPSIKEPDLNKYYQWIQNESFRAFLDMMLLNLPNPARVDPALPKWIVGAEQDLLFPPKTVQQTAAAYGVTATIYKGMAHSSPVLEEGWQTVAKDLHDWITTL